MEKPRLISYFLFLIFSVSGVTGEPSCPAGVAPLAFHQLIRSQIATLITVNGSGPYEFMVDTGAQISVIEPALADELQLKPEGFITVTAVHSRAKVPLVAAALQAGPAEAAELRLVVEALGEIAEGNPGLRGILGNDFLGRFDLLIDYRQKMLCLDGRRQMQQVLRGERVVLLDNSRVPAEVAHRQPLLIRVHLPRDGGPDGTVLRIDSGASVPLLFADRNPATDPWFERSRVVRIYTIGERAPVLYALTPARTVKLAAHQEKEIAFLTPLRPGRKLAQALEDGLIPTTLFQRVFISMGDRFVMFDPR